MLLGVTQPELHELVVVLDDRHQVWEATIVIEPAFGVRGQSAEWRRAVAAIGRPIRLKIVDADL
jgi:hypothetical protein